MELKNLHEHWSGFPAISMEERPILVSEMESMLVRNPFIKDFYLRDKFIIRIASGGILLLFNIFHMIGAGKAAGTDLYALIVLTGMLGWFIIYHIKLLSFAGYNKLVSLSLIAFLDKIERTFKMYIHSFKLTSLLAGFYLQAFIEWIVRICNANAHELIWHNDLYRVIFIAFLSVSVYILCLRFRINKYKKLMAAVKLYREGFPGEIKGR